MKRLLIVLAWTLTPVMSGQVQEPFKLGTFSGRGAVFLGLVVRDSLVVPIAEANAALEGSKPVIPSDMKDLIRRYAQLRPRLYAIANAAAAANRPVYVRDLKSLKILPPVAPSTILNAAVNYREHETEMQRAGAGAPTAQDLDRVSQGIPGIWERQPGDTRQNPYLFLKSPAAVIADGEAIRIPPGRAEVDWECELDAVIGQPASHVPVGRAAEYIFGWTLQNDVSDRGGRPDGRFGTDWLIAKSHDTFAPVGPFIVPKEFVGNPMNLRQRFFLNGQLMQDSNTERMTHNVYEMVSYATCVMTLEPGDLISMGSPAGVGAGRAQPLFMKNGDTSVCTIDSIGSLTNPVVGEKR